MPQFTHLHCHTQYSLLDGAADITALFKKAQADNMRAVALTDHGNMFGAFRFVAEANKYNIKPIVGCEFYIVQDRFKKEFTKELKDNRYHQLLLAKDQEGYKNLSKLCSLGYIEGMYSKWPRIDKELILKYHKGLIATTCCIGAEVPQAILNKGEQEAEKLFKWWLDIFGEDYYVELQRHKLEDQDKINRVLVKFAAKYGVKIIATNDSHYIDQEDSNAHDILLCVNTGELKSTPVGEGKGYRFGFPNNQFYFKTQQEMIKLFSDLPEAIDHTNEIVDKITPPHLKRDILLPNFTLPAGFTSEDDYLKHLTFNGAKRRYKEITSELEERLTHELSVIKTMGFAGYFLIVQDFIAAGRNLGVAVGPGRGSAAGSAVAYCIGITNIDPIAYNLLFERFLNPERISMPDIDIDFDDEGRDKVIDYVVEKYGKNQVAQIITFGSMAAKSSIRDVARVLDLPLPEANALTKLVPDGLGITLQNALEQVEELRELKKGNDIKSHTIQLAEKLEGSIRNTGIHAAGIIIAPNDLTDYIPVCTSKESNLLVTQFDGKYIEEAGMLKMDFLGLKTLTIIQYAIQLIKKNHDQEISIEDIPLNDPKTFELYQRGDTAGTFQFESEGMQLYLRDLKPTDIEDLIAMNALYRPGPLQFIPNFIDRKHGKEKVDYPHELLEPILKNTYGIMVYQEQIMQAAQILGGYTLGQADLLRRAMGKKDREKMAKERDRFVKGAAEKHQISNEKAEEVFNLMERFAEYGFNRSHSAAYSVVAYQTAYLKANYPGEYMAAVLTHNMSNLDKITYFIDECKRLSILVLGPDINESSEYFDVNQEGKIRFGLGAIKGAGEAAVQAIISERTENGKFQDIFDFARRVNLRTVNKKTFECLAQAGAFDCFTDIHRAQYFHDVDSNGTFIEKIVRYGSTYQSNKNSIQHSLFGEGGQESIGLPKIPICEPWNAYQKLTYEKEMVGFYISGHPLDHYKLELTSFCTCALNAIENYKNKDIAVAGIVSNVQIRQGKNGRSFGLFTLEDYTTSIQLALFGEDYLKLNHLLVPGEFLYVKGKVQPRYNMEDRWELRPHHIQLLNEIKEKLAKELIVNIDIHAIQNHTIHLLEEIVQAHPGTHYLKISVYDGRENLYIDLFSKKYKVALSNTVVSELSKLSGVDIKLGI